MSASRQRNHLDTRRNQLLTHATTWRTFKSIVPDTGGDILCTRQSYRDRRQVNGCQTVEGEDGLQRTPDDAGMTDTLHTWTGVGGRCRTARICPSSKAYAPAKRECPGRSCAVLIRPWLRSVLPRGHCHQSPGASCPLRRCFVAVLLVGGVFVSVGRGSPSFLLRTRWESLLSASCPLRLEFLAGTTGISALGAGCLVEATRSLWCP